MMLKTINQWLSRRMFVCTLSALATGYFATIQPSPFWEKAIIILFAYITFVTSASTSFREFVSVAKRPYIPIYILFLLHAAVPVIAWVIGHVFFPGDPLVRIGYLISAAIPIGVTSVIWVSAAKGNVPISLVAVTLDSLLTPVLLPLYFRLVIGAEISIDYIEMARDLFFMVTLPGIAGMLLYDLSQGSIKQFTQSIGGLTAKIALFIVIFLNSSFVAPTIIWSSFVLKVLLVTLLSVTAGYALGYIGSLLLPDKRWTTIIAVIYNTGLRNVSLGLVLAITYFPPGAAIPITLSMLFQQPLAAILPRIYRFLSKKKRPPTLSRTSEREKSASSDTPFI